MTTVVPLQTARRATLALLAMLAVAQARASLTTSAPSPVLLAPRQSDFDVGSFLLSAGGSIVSEFTQFIASADSSTTSSSSTPTTTSATTTSSSSSSTSSTSPTSSTTSSSSSSSTTSSSTTSSRSSTSSSTDSTGTSSRGSSTGGSSNTISATPASQQSDQAGSTTSSSHHHGISGRNLGIILGVVLGVVALIFLILLCLCCLRRRGKKRARRNQLIQSEAEKGNHFNHEAAPMVHNGGPVQNTHSPLAHQGTQQMAHHHDGPSPAWLAMLNRRPSQRTPGLERHPAFAGYQHGAGAAQRSPSFRRARKDPLVPVVSPAELSDTSSSNAANGRANGVRRPSQEHQATAPLLGDSARPGGTHHVERPPANAYGVHPQAGARPGGAAAGFMPVRTSVDGAAHPRPNGPSQEMSRFHDANGGHDRSSSDQSFSTPPMAPAAAATQPRTSTNSERRRDLNPFLSQDRGAEQDHLVSPILPRSTNTSGRSRDSGSGTYYPSENEGLGAPMFGRQRMSIGRQFGGRHRQRYYSNSVGGRSYPYEGT